MKWTEFDPATGRIRQSVWGVQIEQPAPSPTLGVLSDLLIDPAVAYVDPSTAVLTNRPATSISLIQSGSVVTLSGVALGTTVFIGGDVSSSIAQDATDGHLEITFADAGDYSITAEQFPELPFSAAVTVT